MPAEEALSLAVGSLNRGELSKAEDICAEVLQHAPENARAWHLCGIIYAQRADLGQAAVCFENATQYEPKNATYHYNLGLAYRGLAQTERAVQSYREAIAQRDDFPEARNNLGNALMELGENKEAIDCFRELVELTPQSSDVHYNLANLLADTGNVDESLAHYHLALELTPDFPAARENLGRALTDNGRPEEAEQVWKAWLKRDPDSAVARHMLASMSGKNVPKRCDDMYIRQTFDESFARNYDHQLARIQYKAPELVREAIERLECELADRDVLDAGCGTGLCGAMIGDGSRRLVGVDLSEDMLAEAQRRGVYDETIACEITEYMKSHLRAFDLIVSSDTLCYFGNLDEVLRAAYACLRDRGTLIFTVELAMACEKDEPYTIRTSGRYCHAEEYVTESLRNLGFSILNLTPATLRTERGLPVDGLVVTASRRSQ